jgi:hypothetical protein
MYRVCTTTVQINKYEKCAKYLKIFSLEKQIDVGAWKKLLSLYGI